MIWKEKLDQSLASVAAPYPYRQIQDDTIWSLLWDLTLRCGPVPGRREIAIQKDISEREFSRQFRDELSVSWGTYCRDLRLIRAVTLLVLDQEIRIGEVATEAGYSGNPAMTAAFRSTLGVTPRFIRMHSKHDVARMLEPHDDWVRCWWREPEASCD